MRKQTAHLFSSARASLIVDERAAAAITAPSALALASATTRASSSALCAFIWAFSAAFRASDSALHFAKTERIAAVPAFPVASEVEVPVASGGVEEDNGVSVPAAEVPTPPLAWVPGTGPEPVGFSEIGAAAAGAEGS